MFNSSMQHILKALCLIPGTTRTLVGNDPAFAPDFLLKGGLQLRKDLCFDITFSAVYVSQQFWQDTNIGNAADPESAHSGLQDF